MNIESNLVWFAVTVVCFSGGTVRVTLTAQELQSGVYTTVVGATMEECGDWLATGTECAGLPNFPGRVLPFAATVTLDLEGLQPSMSAIIYNAVWEGGAPFELEIESTLSQISGDNYRFSGDYYPPDSGYLFDWEFSPNLDGNVLLNGGAFWTGGHFWRLTQEDVVFLRVPEPGGGVLTVFLLAALLSSKRRQ